MNMIKEAVKISKAELELGKIRNLVAEESNRVNHLLANDYHSTIPIVSEITDYIIQCGGKRLRPLVLLLVTNALGYQGEASAPIAAAIEFMHTASLLHDDVIDDSTLRRGQQTASSMWSNAKAVLVGDFLYTYALKKIFHMEGVPLTPISRAFAHAANLMVEGEVTQLINRRNIHLDEMTYFEILYGKTGVLFELAAQIGGILADANPVVMQAAKDYGKHLGIAFQIIDDMLDYSASAKKLGKNIGDDLAEGSLTLPLIYACKNSSGKEQEFLYQAIENAKNVDINQVIAIVKNCGALEYTGEFATQHAERALAALENFPQSSYREGLATLAKFAVQRDF